jgi:hypothetical protein
METDSTEYIAWRAFLLGLRVAANVNEISDNVLQNSAYTQLLHEIARGELTLQNSPSDGTQIPSIAELQSRMTNQTVIADRQLAEMIAQGFDKATSVPDD